MDLRERRVKLEKLAKLTGAHVEVMYYRCLDKNVSEITDILKKENEGTIWSRFTRIFRLLEISGEDELVTEYCPIFQEFIKSEDDLKNWGTIRSEILRQAWALPSQSENEIPSEASPLPEEEKASLESREKQEKLEAGSTTSGFESPELQDNTKTGQEQLEPSHRPIWALIAIPALILCLLCVGTFSFGARFLPTLLGEVVTPNETLAIQAPSNTAASLPTETPPDLPSETRMPTLTDTPIPFTPTNPTPTLTNLPTETATLQPSALFETDFESGFPAGMEYVRDDLDIVNGELIAHEYTLLGFGNETWKNYQVEYEARKNPYCWQLQNNGVAAHALDQEDMAMWSWNYCETGWFEIVNGNWTIIAHEDGLPVNPGTMNTIKLVANNGNFEIYINNRKVSSYFDDKYLQGKAYILVTNSSVIDNIRISQLP
jgi:hypothetical protein